MKTIGGWLIVALFVFGVSIFTNEEIQEPVKEVSSQKVILSEPKLKSPEQILDSVVSVEKKKIDTVVENVEKNVKYLQKKIKEIDTITINDGIVKDNPTHSFKPF